MLTFFQPFPAEVVFRDYQPFSQCEQTLYLRNNDSFARRIKILSPDSEFFRVVPVRSKSIRGMADGKIAAGMEVQFTIKFMPHEQRVYTYDLVCVTEREKFVIPIRAVGTQAYLDFPDNISFGSCPVKHASSKTFLVRNIGDCGTKCMLQTSAPFKASISNSYVGVNGTAQVSVEFTPQEVRDYSGQLEVVYDTGQVVCINLTGGAHVMNVRLGERKVLLEPAYITLCSQKTVKIYNHSDIPVRFDWKAFRTSVEEQAERMRLGGELEAMEG